MWKLRTVLRAFILLLTFDLCEPCGPAEYRAGDHCCLMCAPGRRVLRHCTGETRTTCAPCLAASFIDEPSSLDQCKPCTLCDPGNGLKIKKACTSTSDTACEPLEGHHCIDPDRDACRAARQHSACMTGQYITQPGTALTDTVCGDCDSGSYSNGSASSCLLHTQCELLGLKEMKAGSPSSDAECGETPSAVIAGLCATGIGMVGLAGLVLYVKSREVIKCGSSVI